MRMPNGSPRRAPLDPVVLLLGNGARVDYMHTKLRRLGGSVGQAASIADAIPLFRDCSGFDAVVINADLPADGLAIAQELRNASGCQTPIWVVANGAPGAPLRAQARASGVQFFRRHDGLHLLLQTLIRRTLARLAGLGTRGFGTT